MGNSFFFFIFWWFLKQIHDNLQQIFESDVQNPQNTTLPSPGFVHRLKMIDPPNSLDIGW